MCTVDSMVSAPILTASEVVLNFDNRVYLQDVSWEQFEAIVVARGEVATPRLAYLEGELELMSPSRTHEKLGGIIGHLVEAYALDRGIEICPYGSWLVRSAPRARGLEPDECYIFGTDQESKSVPDLAIEVIWTSGGIDKLQIYSGLEVPEVWFWQHDEIRIFVLDSGSYHEKARSLALPDLDLQVLCRHLEHPTLTQAVRAFRAEHRV